VSETVNPLDLAAAPPPPVETEWHRLNPLMLVIHPLKELVTFIPALVALLILGNGGGWQQWLGLIGVVLLVIRGVLHWFTARYRITSEQVELRSGLFIRKARAVPRDRIRTVDITAEWQHRLVGLCALKIGTGRHDKGKGDELILDAVTKAEAERLRTELLRKTAARTEATESTVDSPTETVLATVDRRWTRFAPFTLSGFAVVGALAGTLFHFAHELHLAPANVGLLRTILGLSPWVTVPVAVVALLVVGTIMSVAGYVLSYWNFRVTREGTGTLHIRHGLLTTRSVSIEENRLRGVEVKQTLPLRLVRGGRCTAIVTGLRTGRGDEKGGGLLLPAAPLSEAHRVAAKALREPEDPTTAELLAHPKAARQRRLNRAVVSAVVLIVLAWLTSLASITPDWLWKAALVLLPLSILVGLDRYRGLGHTLAGHYLVSRSGSMVRETVALRSDGIIGWRLHSSYFQRRAGLMTVVATTAAGKGGYHITDVSTAEAIKLVDDTVPGLITQFLER
jgi:putative membrane protein